MDGRRNGKIGHENDADGEESQIDRVHRWESCGPEDQGNDHERNGTRDGIEQEGHDGGTVEKETDNTPYPPIEDQATDNMVKAQWTLCETGQFGTMELKKSVSALPRPDERIFTNNEETHSRGRSHGAR